VREEVRVEREYDLFEQFADGSYMWRAHASGLSAVRSKLDELSRTTTNVCFAMYVPDKAVVARVNVSSRSTAKPLLFQIGYENNLLAARSEVLRGHGYDVVSVIGNEAAKVVLNLPQHWDLFILGDHAPEERRKEMVSWLKTRYPEVPVLALNPPSTREIPGADYNVEQNGPELWLPVIASAFRC
jgi:hypothetical protein